MRRLIVFNNVSLDGYFTGSNGDFSWAHQGTDDAEYQAFVAENASGGGQLLLGRITYELMASYWPTADQDPSALKQATWSNSQLVRGDVAAEVRKLKNEPGPGMAILGSGAIVAQLAPEGLIDEYQVMVNPVVLGSGRTMFAGIPAKLNLKLTKTRPFRNGKVLLSYEPDR